ncbi:Ref family recombination enhancement nuclease [Pandoraea commovens]|uniref:DUF968 domain-containing protein n=1 Tax=Pandoraea commovens TaxID=2508289 RepID=A0A5E4SIT7_9BURK|nr:hypothetical protein PCO31010_00811 [Pandoraea commovens]
MSWARKTSLRSSVPLARSPFKRKSRKRAKKAEREHMGVVAGLYCVVCRNLGYDESPAEVHHVRFLAGGGQRAEHADTIPLCPLHHRVGGYGVAFHAGPAEFQRRYGTEAELLEQTRRDVAHRIFASVAPEVA